MDAFEEARGSHLELSRVDLRFRELAKDSPELLDRQSFRSLDEDKALLSYRLQSWPTFVGAEKMDELRRVSVGISRLLRTVPERVFRRDLKKIAEFYGLPSLAIAQVLLTPPTGAEAMISRADFIDTARGFQCIEFNFTPHLGGWDTTIITGRQLALPPVARFIAEEGLQIGFTDTLFEMLRHIIEDVDRKGIVRGDTMTAVLMVSQEDLPDLAVPAEHLRKEMQRTLAALGSDREGRLLCCAPEDVVQKGNSLFFSGQKIDAIVDLSGAWPSAPIYRAFKGNFVGLYNGAMGPLLSSKRNLALLSEHAGSGAYSAEERAFIEAHVPWTRLVLPGMIEHEGRQRPIEELLIRCRERMVLKDADEAGGKGVVLGRSASEEEWRLTIERALREGDWIVQEAQKSLPYLYQSGDYGCSVHEMIWGPFVFGDRFGGVVLRMQPRAAGGAVNLSLHATEGIVLEV
ncbi:MAG TPA: hypothetical protein VMW27_29890 [Thermoanaerobaculia bacterium]|nr:hypothetical protein [Thermoanaerobaculia bacterium]